MRGRSGLLAIVGLSATMLAGCHNGAAPDQAEKPKSEMQQELEQLHVQFERDKDGTVVSIDATLAGSSFTDEHMSQVLHTVSVKTLVLTRTAITNDGLKGISRLKNLQALFLDDTSVGDAGLPHIASCSELRELSLTGSQVSDKGIAKLAALRKLRKLVLFASKASTAAVKKLQKQLPKTKIWN